MNLDLPTQEGRDAVNRSIQNSKECPAIHDNLHLDLLIWYCSKRLYRGFMYLQKVRGIQICEGEDDVSLEVPELCLHSWLLESEDNLPQRILDFVLLRQRRPGKGAMNSA